MSDIVNGMLAAIIGAVAWIAVHAMVSGNIYGTAGNTAYNSSTAAPGEMIIHDILPLAIAIMTVATIFIGLTRLKGA